MTDFKDYSDDQLINKIKLLADEITERNLDFKLANKVEEKDSLETLASFILFKNSISSQDFESSDEVLTQVMKKFNDTVDDLQERISND